MVAVILVAVLPLIMPLMTAIDGETARPVPLQGIRHRTMVGRLWSERTRVGSIELQYILRRRSEALTMVARVVPILAPSPLLGKPRWLLFLTHTSFVSSALPRGSRLPAFIEHCQKHRQYDGTGAQPMWQDEVGAACG